MKQLILYKKENKMKRTFFIRIVIIATAIVFFSCEKPSECACTDAKEYEKFEINKKEYLMKCMIPEEVSGSTVNKLIICNHTKRTMNYGHDWSLEYYDNNHWTSIPLDMNWPDNLLGLSAYQTLELKQNLYLLAETYNNAIKGKYRRSFDVYLYDWKKHKHYGSYGLYFEFEIN